MPAEWAVTEALRRINKTRAEAGFITLRDGSPAASATVAPLAEMIEKHEQPPADPDLLLAREIAAAEYVKAGAEECLVESVLLGRYDTFPCVRAALAALKRRPA